MGGHRVRSYACGARQATELTVHRQELKHLELREVLSPRRPDVEARQEVVQVPARRQQGPRSVRMNERTGRADTRILQAWLT